MIRRLSLVNKQMFLLRLSLYSWIISQAKKCAIDLYGWVNVFVKKLLNVICITVILGYYVFQR